MKSKVLKIFTLLAMTVPLMACGGHVHAPAATWSSDATNHWHACTDSSCQEKLNLAAHSWDAGTVVKAATCTADGSMEYKCTVCQYSRTEAIPATGHHAATAWSSDATNHWHVCENSGCTEKLNLEGHSWDEGTVLVEPTCTEGGSKVILCTVCGYSKTEQLDPLGHHYVVDSYTWSEIAGGMKCAAHAHCDREDCTAVVDEEVNGSYEVVTNPTCYEFGSGKYTAAFTKQPFTTQTKTVQIAKLDHVYGDPTYTWTELQEGGYSVSASKSCTNEGCSEVVSADASTVEVTEDVASTCSVKGHITYTATFAPESGFANATKTVERELAPHTPGSTWIHEDGDTHWHICSVCQGKCDEEDHTFVDGECEKCQQQRVYTSLADLTANGVSGNKYTVVGKVTALFAGKTSNGVYIADGESAIQIYGWTNSSVKVGDYVEVVNGEYLIDSSYGLEIKKVTGTTVNILSKAPTHKPISTPVDYEIVDNETWKNLTKTIQGNTALNREVEFKGILTSRPETISKDSDNRVYATDESGAEVLIFVRKNLAEEVYTGFNALEPGSKFTVRGIVGTYKGDTQIIAPGVPSDTSLSLAAVTSNGVTEYFDSMTDAVNSVDPAKGQATIKLLKDQLDGEGIIVDNNKNIVFDLNGHTYRVHGPAVGSTGTQTLGFQLLKGTTVKFKNGTVDCYDTTVQGYEPITGDRICVLIQNYSNLSLENVTIDHTKGKDAKYAVSNNYGSLSIDKDSKIIAASGKVAFDMWYGMSSEYQNGIMVSPAAELDNTSIQGKIEYGHANHTFSQTSWFNRSVVMDGTTKKTVNDASSIAANTVKSYADYEAFKADWVATSNILLSIDVTVDPEVATLEYEYGDTFSIAGVTVTANYDDESSADVTALATFDPADGTSLVGKYVVAKYTVDVSYTESSVTKTGSFDISVTDEDRSTVAEALAAADGTTGVTVQGVVVEKHGKGYLLADDTGIMEIKLSADPTNEIGDFVRVTGDIEAKFGKDGANKTNRMKNPVDGGTPAGVKPTISIEPVTMTNEEWDAYVPGAAGAVAIKGVGKVASTTTFEYYESKSDLDPATGKASRKGSLQTPPAGLNFTGLESVGTYVEFEGFIFALTSQNVIFVTSYSVYVPETTSIALTIDKDSIKVGETAQLTAVCSPVGASQDIDEWILGTEGIVTVDDDGVVTPVAAGSTTIKAKQGSVSSNAVTVTVQSVTLSKIEISGTMTKTSYSVGDDWDPKGLVITATYSDSSTADVTDNVEWSYNPAKADATTTTSVAVTASFDGQTDTENVTVTVAEKKTYEKVSSIAIGDQITFVNTDNKVELGSYKSGSTPYFNSSSYTTIPTGVNAVTVEAGAGEGQFSFKLSDGDYLAWGSGNSLKKQSAKDAGSSWIVSFDKDGNATVVCAKKDGSDQRYLKYNSGSPRFACYKSGQSGIVIYAAK